LPSDFFRARIDARTVSHHTMKGAKMLPNYERIVTGELVSFAGELLELARGMLILTITPEEVGNALEPIIIALSDRARDLKNPL